VKGNGWIEAVVFYEELQVRGKVKKLGEDPSTGIVDWKVESRLIVPISSARQFFIRQNGRTYLAEVVYQEGDVVSTTAPVRRYDPRFNRKNLRVTTSLSSPVEAFISDYYSVEPEEKKYRVLDVSEFGISVVAPADDSFKIDDDLIVSLVLSYGGKKVSFTTKGKVVRLERIRDGVERVSIFFPDISPKNRDLLAGYIISRQREIIQNIQRVKW